MTASRCNSLARIGLGAIAAAALTSAILPVPSFALSDPTPIGLPNNPPGGQPLPDATLARAHQPDQNDGLVESLRQGRCRNLRMALSVRGRPGAPERILIAVRLRGAGRIHGSLAWM